MRRKRKKNNQIKLITLTSISLLFILTVGYAAFSTNLNITAKGNILNTDMTTKELKKKYCNQTTGDGLYKDTYEEGRCIYKGSNPSNYIKFNDESWRILAIEADGTLKIMKAISLGNMAWDSSNSNNWDRPATLNTYLNNDYYNTLSSEVKSQIQEHTWAVGPVIIDNSDLFAQIELENSIKWDGNIGLVSASDALKANSNTSCSTLKSSYDNRTECKLTNYLIPQKGRIWTISQVNYNTRGVHRITYEGNIGNADAMTSEVDIHPVLYLKPDVTLKGEGTEINPYEIN